MGPTQIADHTFWVGVNDRETDLFESVWPIPRGISYNAYVIADEKVALVDTVKSNSFDTFIEKVRHGIGSRGKVDYLIVNHMEPDHSGVIRRLLDCYPDLKIVGNKKTAALLDAFYGISENVHVVTDGDTLRLGSHTLQFHLTPMVHWPETMMTYDMHTKVLFAGDAFGTFGALDGGVFDDEVDVDYYDDEILRYFSNIVGKYSKMVQKALGKLSGLDIAEIASTHGPVWREHPERIVSIYDKWSAQEPDPGLVIVYGSMYRNTECMMEHVAKGAVEAGLKDVRVHNVPRSHLSYVLRDAWRYQGLVLGTPTYDAGIFPPMDAVVRLLEEKRLAKRTVGLFGTYGWSGGGVKGLRAFVEGADLELVEPVVEACCSATEEQLDSCRELGRCIAQRVM
ncbi:MAG: FprA family A-type flavoprotein [Candidatus Pacebacteria bacterium]|nr:FprA family A-type flavoprotein [Candidatus Paceibacterota bacterium]